MPLYLSRLNQPLGAYELAQIALGLQTGQFLPSDWAWCPGWPSWALLRDIPELRAYQPPHANRQPQGAAGNPKPPPGETPPPRERRLAARRCGLCDGAGGRMCHSCRATGRVRPFVPTRYSGNDAIDSLITKLDEIDRHCRTCNGTGKIPCDRCGGSGRELVME